MVGVFLIQNNNNNNNVENFPNDWCRKLDKWIRYQCSKPDKIYFSLHVFVFASLYVPQRCSPASKSNSNRLFDIITWIMNFSMKFYWFRQIQPLQNKNWSLHILNIRRGVVREHDQWSLQQREKTAESRYPTMSPPITTNAQANRNPIDWQFMRQIAVPKFCTFHSRRLLLPMSLYCIERRKVEKINVMVMFHVMIVA